MKILKLDLKIEDLKLEGDDVNLTPPELVFSIIKGMALNYSNIENGLGEEDRRKYSKLCDAIELAIDREQLEVELEDDYAKFLKRCKSKSKFMPNKLTQRVEVSIDQMKEKEKEEK